MKTSGKTEQLLFNEDKYVDGKLTFEKGKIYDIPVENGSFARWVKRGCTPVKDIEASEAKKLEDAKKLREKEERLKKEADDKAKKADAAAAEKAAKEEEDAKKKAAEANGNGNQGNDVSNSQGSGDNQGK